jgi:lipoprotein-anchoring transpeptidase ErfK/SrfK
MSQKNINVGTVANDGTGDTIRGAFTNVNANFTEVYSNVDYLFYTVPSAYDKANSVDVLAHNIGASGNNWAMRYANTVGDASNSRIDATDSNLASVAISANAWSSAYTNTVGLSANTYAGVMSNSVNSVVSVVAVSSNAYTDLVGASVNSAVSIGLAAANTWSNTLANVAATNFAVAINADRVFMNASFQASNNWSNVTFQTIANGSASFARANQAFILANNSFQNTTGTLVGSLTVQGFLQDFLGPVREKRNITIDSNSVVQAGDIVIMANNNSNPITISIDNDGKFLYVPNTGSKVEVYRIGTGDVTIAANDAFVTILSSNNWANISNQYRSVDVVKIRANTWMITGDLTA